ncbi:carboxymuconolactone decarboxylase family protein [Frigidibacter sp. MR17.24]|uniref:carboxymuconolactone decarboxylase family protein n=1 Tax=Frigidibacter sp. MR17.24 TaxID=3127345 RepID=UPI003012B380
MTPRMTDHMKRADAGFRPLYAVEAAIRASSLEPLLVHLVKLRASQINGCAFCIQMHVAEALKDGETPLRLHMLPAWRESPLYSPRERAALAWTEALTRLPDSGAPDADWAEVEAAFDTDERAWLTIAIGAINLWNRVQAGLRVPHATTLPGPRADAA